MGDGAWQPEPVSVGPPPGPAVAPLGFAFTDVAFLHWRYPPDVVRPLLPPATVPDTVDGVAYVGLVGFRMRCYGEFLELNVRTYAVDARGRRTIVFLAMEADRLPWVLAARALGLPYRWARMGLARNVHVVEYRSARHGGGPGARMRIRVGPPVDGTPLDHFLTARWRLHHRVPGATVTARLTHDRWPLHAADLVDLEESLVVATGLPAPTGPPDSVLWSPGVRGRFGLPAPG